MKGKEKAEILHIRYEDYAEGIGWKTQKECRVDFKDLPKKNKEVMLMIADSIIGDERRALKEQAKRIFQSFDKYKVKGNKEDYIEITRKQFAEIVKKNNGVNNGNKI